jgi:hypothetical protein
MSSLETLPAPDLEASLDDKWRREQRAFRQLLPELLRTHPGQFVAIHEGRVVESGDDKIDVARRAYARFGYIPIFISRVIAGPLAIRRSCVGRRMPTGEHPVGSDDQGVGVVVEV